MTDFMYYYTVLKTRQRKFTERPVKLI